ncbi:hypothetical protein E2C01_036926 [Portunus trituberculatus]|uniref:Uncharacterized protein n=1 Tax=Portunus trituberculatus TaxID=210409 RepID=A0A5B7FDS6_PORTR|nr:hypothetical protein [Portunus trituberculatus]
MWSRDIFNNHCLKDIAEVAKEGRKTRDHQSSTRQGPQITTSVIPVTPTGKQPPLSTLLHVL